MNKILKGLLIVLGVLVGLILLAVIGIYFASESRLNQKYSAPAISLTVPTDAQSIERGKYLATRVSVCIECHGENLGGKVLVDDPALGRIVALNLTTGKNGEGSELSDDDLLRVLRYGVKPDGHSVLVMPSEDYTHLSDEDLVAIAAYVRSVPPVDSNLPESVLRPMGRALLAAGKLPILIAANIDFNAPHVATMTPAVSVEYGSYLADIAGCTGCHGPGLSGGLIPGAPPDFPAAANLTPSGELIGWSEEQFFTLIRTGTKPNGKPLNEVMPYKYYGQMSDDELKAIWMFIKSVPAREAGTR